MNSKLKLLTVALSSALILTACHDDDDHRFSNGPIEDTPENNINTAPTLALTVKPVAKAEVAVDSVVIEAQGSDAENDTLTYSLTNNDENYYVINSETGAVSLTQAGVTAINADMTLPTVDVLVSDGELTATQSATPKITDSTTPPSSDPSLTALLADDPQFSTLAAALQAVPGDAEMNLGKDIEQLDSITVLAPTNDAIDKTLDILAVQMPELDTNNNGEVELTELLDNPELLKSLLQYHVLTSTVESSQVTASVNKNLGTVNGLPLFVTQVGSDFVIPSQIIQLANAASSANQTTQAKIDLQNIDIKIDNGVVHVIDQALIPPMYDIDETLAKLPETEKFRDFLAIVGDDTGSVASVSTDKDATSYTVLAPNNATVNQTCVNLNPSASNYTGGVPIIDANNECDVTPLASFGAAVNQFVPIPNNIKSGTMFTGELGDIKGNVVDANFIAKNGVVQIVDSLQ